MKNYGLILFLSVLLVYGCKKDDENAIPVTPQENSLNLQLGYEVDGQTLLFDTLIYTNAAGNNYAVSRLWYYLSQINLVRADSNLVPLKDYQFVDARTSSTNTIQISEIPAGDYIGMTFNIGLDSAHNLTGALPVTVDNLNMEWPVQMGGGYHFMKFEGHASDTAGAYGFAMHLGLDMYLIKCKVWSPIHVHEGATTINMVMNLNEWFRNPAVYDFNIDGNYSMGVMTAMTKLKQNGVDVFTIQ